MKNYTKELEDLFIGFMIKDGELYVRCQNIINSEFFLWLSKILKW